MKIEIIKHGTEELLFTSEDTNLLHLTSGDVILVNEEILKVIAKTYSIDQKSWGIFV